MLYFLCNSFFFNYKEINLHIQIIFHIFFFKISALYKKDPHGLQLNCEYWIPPEPLGGVFSPHPIRKAQQSLEQKKVFILSD